MIELRLKTGRNLSANATCCGYGWLREVLGFCLRSSPNELVPSCPVSEEESSPGVSDRSSCLEQMIWTRANEPSYRRAKKRYPTLGPGCAFYKRHCGGRSLQAAVRSLQSRR